MPSQFHWRKPTEPTISPLCGLTAGYLNTGPVASGTVGSEGPCGFFFSSWLVFHFADLRVA